MPGTGTRLTRDSENRSLKQLRLCLTFVSYVSLVSRKIAYLRLIPLIIIIIIIIDAEQEYK
jgi:hypothetical protein